MRPMTISIDWTIHLWEYIRLIGCFKCFDILDITKPKCCYTLVLFCCTPKNTHQKSLRITLVKLEPYTQFSFKFQYLYLCVCVYNYYLKVNLSLTVPFRLGGGGGGGGGGDLITSNT